MDDYRRHRPLKAHFYFCTLSRQKMLLGHLQGRKDKNLTRESTRRTCCKVINYDISCNTFLPGRNMTTHMTLFLVC